MGYQTVENEWFKTEVVSEGIVVALFSGSIYQYNKDYRNNIRNFINYISKPNVTKVHLIFDSGNKNCLSDKFLRSHLSKSLLRLIYNTNPNVRVVIHSHNDLKDFFKLLYYTKRDCTYKPRVVTDIDNKKPLYFRIGDYAYVKIISHKTKFIVTIVDKMYS